MIASRPRPAPPRSSLPRARRAPGSVLVLAFALVCGLAAPPTDARARADDPPGGIPVGAARVDLTPSEPVRLSGYAARTGPSVGTDRPIFATALAIGEPGRDLTVLVAVDVLGVPDAMVESVAESLRARHGLPRERLAITATHTHSAPCVAGLAPNLFGGPLPPDEQAAVDRFTAKLRAALERACDDAIAARAPARLVRANGKAGFAANRRTPDGPVDHDLPILAAFDLDPDPEPEGEGDSPVPRAVVANYACHCTTLDPADNLVAGDWAGDARDAIEAKFPGTIPLILIGCGGDANPRPRLARQASLDHGAEIADEIARLLAGPLEPLPPAAPSARFRRVRLDLAAIPDRERLEALAARDGHVGYNARLQLDRLDRGEPPLDHVDYPVQTWEFADRLLMVFLAGEVVVDYALRLKRELDPARLWVTAYANDCPCYIPSERVLREGGYEGGGAMLYYGLPAPFAPGLEDKIVAAVRASASPAFVRAAQPQAEPEPEFDPDRPPPMSPEDSLRAFRVKPGLRVELVASEPLVVDPIAIDFDPDGALWVCEMRDYPTGVDRNWKPGGVVKRLVDRNGDGRYDHAAEFLRDLPFPTGLMAWRGGLLVCAAPRILFAKDDDGDGVADTVRTLYEGFSTENYQARVNSPHYGLDNWIYAANGLFGGEIRSLATGRSVNLGARDLRIRPDVGAIEPESGLTQQGRTRDDWGNAFGVVNWTLLKSYPFPDRYAARNPAVPSPDPNVMVPAPGPDANRLYPASRTIRRYNDPHLFNRVTSACGPAIYRDDLLGAEYAGDAFTCEPVHNIVHRRVLTPVGPTFVGQRPDDELASEFLASRDNWFRPCQVVTGPDGALYIVDIYRFVIEHPRWIGPEQLATLDVRAGDDKGRIYRVVPEGRPLRPVPRLDGDDPAPALAALESPNGPLRDMAQRRLVELGPAARPVALALERLAAEHPRPITRAHALRTLEGLGVLALDRIRAALDDPDPKLRREAVKLAELHLDRYPELAPILVARVDDPDSNVRFQAALALGARPDPSGAAGRALAGLALREGADPWTRAAILASASAHARTLLASILDPAVEPSVPPAIRSTWIEPLTATLVAGADPSARREAARELAARLIERPEDPLNGGRLGALAALRAAELGDAASPDSGAALGLDSESIAAILAVARRALDGPPPPPESPTTDADADLAARAAAIRILGAFPVPDDPERVAAAGDRDRLRAALAPDRPASLRAAAVRALADRGDHEVFWELWPGLEPGLRASTLETLLRRGAGAAALLDALERGRLPLRSLDATIRQRLARHPDPVVRQRAEALPAALGLAPGAGDHDRARVVAEVRAAMAEANVPGDPARGSLVFDRVCAACHAFGGQGHEVGPDLAALTDRSPETLLAAILDPNRDVDARYAAYAARLKDGRVLSGMIAAETGNAITLKTQRAETEVVARADIEEIRTEGLSLMPEGLERDVDPAEFADLVAYLNTDPDPPKSFPGNAPAPIRQNPDGSLRLAAEHAAIRGDSLVFETEFRNLGMWHSPNDRATWEIVVDRPGRFTVSMEWACPDELAGNVLLLLGADRVVRHTIGGTAPGVWSTYRSTFVGEIELGPGARELTVRAGAPIRGALLDLRALVLTPRPEPARTP